MQDDTGSQLALRKAVKKDGQDRMSHQTNDMM